MTSLTYVQVTGTFNGADETPLQGSAVFTPSQTLYAGGVPLVSAGSPVTAEIVNGSLRSLSGGTLQLLATDNSGLSLLGNSSFWYWSVQVTLAGEVQPSWDFFLPSSPSSVDLYALASTRLAQFPNPLTALGDLLVGGTAGTPERLPGNTSTTPEVLTSIGTGSAANEPAWQAASALSLPTLAQVSVSAGGTLAVNTITEVTATGSTVPMTLPTPVTGDLIVVERASASNANVTVTGTIRGVTSTITLQLGSESEMFFATAGSWWVPAGHKTLSSLDARYYTEAIAMAVALGG